MLSQGQKQLFCLARAILRPGKIVVLDEVTSSVDRVTDEMMQRIIRDEFKGRTVIAVAHRLETIIDFDRIVVMEDARVVEIGKPDDLLSRKSKFRKLFEASKVKDD
jgi:ATP-binding cassette subfamily C (CFTR/MRP) protein 1